MTDETRPRTREQELQDEFQEGIDPDAPGELAKRLDALTERVAAIEVAIAHSDL